MVKNGSVHVGMSVLGCVWVCVGVYKGFLRGFLDAFWFNVVNIVLMMFFHFFELLGSFGIAKMSLYNHDS